MKISQEEFKQVYGGDLTNLTTRLAVQPKTSPDAKETRKKYEYLEFDLQTIVAKYLMLKYPEVDFESSPINLNLTKGQRKMMKAINKQGFHAPDLKIFEARKGYHGFFLELKKETPYRKDGILKKSEHLENQYNSIRRLRKKGWKADFYWDFEVIKKEIDEYFKGN